MDLDGTTKDRMDITRFKWIVTAFWTVICLARFKSFMLWLFGTQQVHTRCKGVNDKTIDYFGLLMLCFVSFSNSGLVSHT